MSTYPFRRSSGSSSGSGGAAAPLFADDFASDTRGNYTYVVGAAANLTVSAGALAAADAAQALFVPTALAARADALATLKVTVPNDGLSHFPGLALKVVGALDHVYATIDTDTAGLALWQIVGGVATKLSAVAVPGGVRRTLWLIGGSVGAAFFCNAYDVDPAGGAAPIATVIGTVTAPSLGGGAAGKPGIESFNHSGHTVDDFKVYAMAAS